MTENNSIEFQALALFEASLDIDSAERKNWLERKAGNNPDLLKKVLQLLNTEQKHSHKMLTGMAFSDVQETDQHPERIGAYKITQFIGQGGMGAVYKGERDIGDFELEVAIKLIRPGVLSDKLITRFAQEQQTLASLVHPNIARLYDGGKTDNGIPYLIMEYIKGASLHKWLEQHKLSETEVLLLFVKVCEAVNYAHQNLIIHRDITPGNIMMTSSGDVKLIDFGIAKPLKDSSNSHFDAATDASIAKGEESNDSERQLAGLSFTPGFAAPERRHHNLGAVANTKLESSNTLLDIFSLGKLLAFILEKASNNPSKQCIKPELQAIIDKASAPQTSKRYQTVNALLADINNYEQNLPVLAYSSSSTYRFRKFTKRHVKTVVFSSVTAVSLIVALIITINQYYRAEHNFTQANERFMQLQELSTYQLFNLFDQLKRVTGTTESRANLADKAQSYLAILSSQDSAPLSVKLDTVQGYIRLAYVFGVPAQPNLGQAAQTINNLDKADTLLSEIETQYPINSSMQIAKAGILAARAMLYNHNDGNLEQAKKSIDSAANLLNNIEANERSIRWYETRRELRFSELEWADQASDANKLNEYAHKLKNDPQAWPLKLQQTYIKAQDESYYYYWLAMAHYVQGEYKEAVEDFLMANEKLSTLEKAQKNEPMLLYQLAWTNYLAYGATTRFEDDALANAFLDRASEYTERLKALEEHDASIYRLSIQIREAKSQLYANNGDFELAKQVQQGVIDDLQQLVDSGDIAANVFSLAFSHIIMAYLHKDMENRIDTCKSLTTAEHLLAPLAAKNSLPEYMMNAAKRLPQRIVECEAGELIKGMNALFD